MTTIVDWLASIGMSDYAERFHANAIDLSIIGELTEQDLKELEIPLGHRRKLLRAIADYQNPRSVAAPKASSADSAQRRQMTVMFCDLVGSTALSATMDPEDMRGVISAYQRCIVDIVGRHQGMIARYTGDGALIYFGYPQAHEDDAVQAVRTGLALIDEIPKLDIGIGTRLNVTVGIATGIVVVGDIAATDSGVREHAVVGDTPNLASRLQSVAAPGSVAVCSNTHRLTNGYFEYRDLGAVTIKGWAESIRVWQPISSRQMESRFEAEHRARVLLPFGRDEQIELLMRRWQSAKNGEGRAVLLTGEPGIGKSHIALALDALLTEHHVTLYYFCSSHHTNSALSPFIWELERAAGFERGDPPATKWSKLEAWLTKYGPPAEHGIALLSNLLSLPPDVRYPLPAMSPQRQKDATLSALFVQLQQMAATQPVLIIFEDVHWIDPTSLDLLTLIVERLVDFRILLLITARPGFSPPWPGYAYVSTVSLTRLNRDDGAALVKRVTGGKALPDEVLQEILARTDGVPLFVEELTKAVLESGQLQEQRGQYVLGHPLPSLAIPTTLHASLMARLDRLASVREVAQIGAVIGREFSYELLSAVAALPKAKLDEALEQLVQAELIFRRGTIPLAVYSFKHALVRDAAYGGLLKTRRAQLHSALATVFEQKFRDVVETQPEILAHHLTEAGLAEKAVQYWLLAGKKAAQRSANLEAIAHLQKGLEAARAIAEDRERDRTELDIMMVMGPCLIATQGPAGSDSTAAFTHARALCERLGDPPEYLQVMFWFTTASVMRGQLPLAHETIAVLLDRAQAREDRPALLNAIRGNAMILMFMGKIVEAGEMIKRAFETFNGSSEDDRLAARAAGQDAGVADLALMSWTFWLLGQPDTAMNRIDAALQRADGIGHPHSLAYACYYASVLYALCGRPDIARMHAEKCLNLSEMHGFRQWHGLSRAIRGICTTMIDKSSAPLDDIAAALAEYRNAGYELGITALYVLLCPVLLLHDHIDGALEILERGLAAVHDNSERIFECELYRLKASALRLTSSADAPAQSDAMLELALRKAKEQNAKSLELRISHDLAKSLLSHGKREQARDLLAPICDWFEEGEGTRDLREARALLSEARSPAPSR
jgi:class 3 adenylate cyclase/tetratricopeptide (TPR) repeat protein